MTTSLLLPSVRKHDYPQNVSLLDYYVHFFLRLLVVPLMAAMGGTVVGVIAMVAMAAGPSSITLLMCTSKKVNT